MKLGLVTGPPLALVLIMVLALVMPRFSEASAATDNRHRVNTLRYVVEVINRLEDEAALSLWAISGAGEEIRRDLAEARLSTDAAIVEMVSYLEGEAGIDVSEVAPALSAVSYLDEYRAGLDSGVGGKTRYEPYVTTVSLLNQFAIEQVDRSNDPGLIRLGHTLKYLIAAKMEVAQVRAVALPGLQRGLLDLTEFEELVEVKAREAEQFRAYSETTDDENRADLKTLLSGEEAERVTAALEGVLAAARTGSPPPVTAAAWWDALSAKLASLSEFNAQNIDEFVQVAEERASAARNEAITYLLIGLLTVMGATGAAFLLGRALVRGLASVARQADQIATERLPEVLESLRNPTPEALAQALPQVVSTTTDEVGLMANAFNTVLRTSVETAIEHAQRRAQTVTNMLVNLGRRNQALIERQLALMDELESRQEDPAILEKLFRIDQLMTRMRRNAENLVVLAGQKQARKWSEAVPVSDVLRAAASEVSNMGRVKINLGAVDHIDLAGPHAVDVSHLLAELIENSVSCSAPSTQVVLRTERTRDQLKVWITDSGVGLKPAELAEANERLLNPPDIDSIAIDRVGFQVVGRLARQIGGVTVTVSDNPGGGLAACVSLPISLFEVSTGNAPAATVAPATKPEGSAKQEAGTEPPKPMKSDGIHPASALEERLVERRVTPGERRVTPGEPASRKADASPVGATEGHQPALQPVTSTGLVKRRPGRAFGGNEKAAAADAGEFRRLPVPGEDNGEQVQLRRFQTISQLQSAVVNAREEDDDNVGGN